MKFAWNIALKNIRRRPFRAFGMAVLIMTLTFTLLAGAVVITSLQNGLTGYRSRLGADIVVTPSSAEGHGTVEAVLLQGIAGNYYMSSAQLEKLKSIEGIEIQSRQFFLTSAKASCCSARVQIIGFEPQTDISVMPWISENRITDVKDGEILIGADVTMPADGKIRFYGKNYQVAAQLSRTGTGLDQAVYTNMQTIQQMAKSAAMLTERETLRSVNIARSASAVMIRVKKGYSPEEVADDINIHVQKVRATPSGSMVQSVSDGLEQTAGFVSLLTGGIWLLSAVILAAVFAIMTAERKKEFAVLSVMGASRRMICRLMTAEAAFICLIGSLTGLAAAFVFAMPLTDALRSSLQLPFLLPDGAVIAVLCAGAVVLPVATGVLAALTAVMRITVQEPGQLIREDA